ncbi:MAG: D-alanyl-D-alanine carboxypeptidase [Salinarimonadaceae bacterium]|nr:MAG: D-alanyl-D-alanine carboxypeptidase [Salinarimonadaceae bacterium]
MVLRIASSLAALPCGRALAIVLIAFVALAASASGPGGGAAAYNPPYAALVVDVKTGRTLHEENADATRHPASLTKVMTLYLVFERLERGELRLNSPLRVSSRAAAEPPSKLGLRAGSTITLENAILSLVTRSANDAATVIAENLGGSVEAFAREMTETARALGMRRTTFRNAHGLPNSAQVTTARDLSILAIAVQDRFPQYYHYFSRRSFQFAGRAHPNHNRLLGRVEGVDGIKTGFIRASGFNLMTNAKSRDRHIVTIVLGGRSGAHRDGIVERLVTRHLPRAYAGARQTPLVGPGRAVARASSGLLAGVLPPRRPSNIGEPVAAFASVTPPTIPQGDGRAPLDLNAMRPAVASASDAPSTTTPGSSRAIAFAGATGSIPLPPAPIADARPAPEAPSAPAPRQVAALAAPTPPAATAPPAQAEAQRSPWVIQIAAVDSETAAMSMLERARTRIGGPLRKASPFTEPVVANGVTLYRARFSGFDEAAQARDACRQLERNGFACFASRS